jgi:hypothetical protein
MPLHNGGVQIRPLLLADALGAPMNAREFDGQAELASAFPHALHVVCRLCDAGARRCTFSLLPTVSLLAAAVKAA